MSENVIVTKYSYSFNSDYLLKLSARQDCILLT